MALRQVARRAGAALLQQRPQAALALTAGSHVRGYADDGNLQKTALYDLHVAHGGKMVPFAGWSMPIQYKDSIIDSTLHCRHAASIFDVSHMCGLSLRGKGVIPFIEQLVVGDIAALPAGTGGLSVFTNEKGGIIDDTVITKVTDEHLYIVVNAGCRDKDLAHINEWIGKFASKGGDVSIEVHNDRSLLAVQGPKAVAALQLLTPTDLSTIYFSDFRDLELAGIPTWATRTGYTGEDGFEISVPNDNAVALAERLLENSDVKLAGLGPRDSLRLEAGLCLYGNDIDETITPIEAGLAWTVAKRRRSEGGFLGADVILKQIAEGVSKKRVGLFSEGAPARGHSKILDTSGKEVGEVTSGAFSPTLKKNIAMGYVATPLSKSGTELLVEVRGKQNKAVLSKMPFVKTTYYKRT